MRSFILSLVFALLPPVAHPADILGDSADLWEAGFRTGLSANDPAGDFFQTEFHFSFDPPTRLDLPWKLALGPRLNGSAGMLAADNLFGSLISVGPALLLSWDQGRLALEGGNSPTYISRHEFGEKRLGGPFQFISHVALHGRVTGHWTLSYRFQHMSNAGIYSSNPGLNMHLLGIGYRF
jgi:hypothetical protein